MADHAEIIRRNIRVLCDLTKCEARLLDRCAEEGIVTLEECDQIILEKDMYTRNRAFYNAIRKIEPRMYMKLLEIMAENQSGESRELLAILRGGEQQHNANTMAGLIAHRFQKVTLDTKRNSGAGSHAHGQSASFVTPQPQPQQQQQQQQQRRQQQHPFQLSLIEEMVANKSLLNATRQGLIHDVKMLIARGADVNTPGEKNRCPLHYAAVGNHIEIAKILIENGAVVDCMDADSMTPLHAASGHGHSTICDLLIRAGANLNSTTNDDGNTSLHYAAQKGDLTRVQWLVENGANIHVLASTGWSPLHKAIWYGHPTIVQYLISKGADVWGRTGKDTTRDEDLAKTCLHLAAGGHSNVEVMRLILEAGKRLCGNDHLKMKGWLNALDSVGDTALFIAVVACMSHDETANDHRALKVLLEYEPNFHIKDRKYGLTPMEVAKKYKRVYGLKYMKKVEEAQVKREKLAKKMSK